MNYPSEISIKCKRIIETTDKYNLSGKLKEFKDEIFELTKHFPDKVTLSQRAIAIAKDSTCICRFCEVCHGIHDKDYCSHKCYLKSKTINSKVCDECGVTHTSVKRHQLIYNEHPEEYASLCVNCFGKYTHKFYNESNSNEWCECSLCGFRSPEIGQHLKHTHPEHYKTYTGKRKSKKICDSMSGENNPAFGHGGTLSPFSKKFKNGYNEDWNEKQKERQSKWSKENSVFSRQKYNSEEEYLKAQRRDLEHFTTKYGEEEGRVRYKSKTEKWLKSFKKNNYSKVSQTLFDKIMETYVGNVYYATYERDDKTDYVNKEYRLELDTTFCLPDFIDVGKRKIIEFDGIYWHRQDKVNKERDNIRDSKIIKAGYTILHICELEYKKFPKETVEKCINFLTQ